MSTSQKEQQSETGLAINIASWQVSGCLIGGLIGPAVALAFALQQLDPPLGLLLILVAPALGLLGGILGTLWAMKSNKS